MNKKLIILILMVFANPLYSIQNDHFTAGRKFAENGDITQALTEWEKGKFFLEEKGQCDPRIGRAYIETVAENGLKDKYEKASEFCMWGISGDIVDEGKEEIFAEAERIVPLLNNEEAEEWNELIKNKDFSLKDKIKGFWIMSDPTQATPYNERLIEHWGRVAYSRKTFTKNKNSIYKCDDRGVVYVKLGEPFQKKEGNLGTNQTELYRWAGEIIEFLSFEDFEGRRIPGNITIVNDNALAIVKKVRETFNFPEYEIWSYKFENLNDPTFYIFGPREGTGSFGIRESIEEFIPNRAYYNTKAIYIKSRITGKGDIVFPGSLLQIMFYENLRMLGGVFDDRYNELCMAWKTIDLGRKLPDRRTFQTYHTRFESRDVDNTKIRYVPEYISDFDESIDKINISTTQLRMLDEDNNPKLALVAMSFPGIQGEVNIADIISGKFLKQDYDLTHTLKVHDGNWNEIDRITDKKTEGSDNTSVFVVDHSEANNNYILSAGAVPKNAAFADKLEIGKVIIDPVEPLDTDHSRLEISDIITGILVPEGLKETSYPFPVIPAESIHKGDPFMVYIEAYHLSLGPDGKAHFEIEFSYEYWKKRRFGVKKRQQVSQKFPFESQTIIAEEMAGFDVSDLEPGEYEFTVT
ncbi:GWxTD domain-containing protein, partial [candidate division KSB1 bacterium]